MTYLMLIYLLSSLSWGERDEPEPFACSIRPAFHLYDLVMLHRRDDHFFRQFREVDLVLCGLATALVFLRLNSSDPNLKFIDLIFPITGDHIMIKSCVEAI